MKEFGDGLEDRMLKYLEKPKKRKKHGVPDQDPTMAKSGKKKH